MRGPYFALLLLVQSAGGLTLTSFSSLTGTGIVNSRCSSCLVHATPALFTLSFTFKISGSVLHTQSADSFSITFPTAYYHLLAPADPSSVTLTSLAYNDGTNHACSSSIQVSPEYLRITASNLDCGGSLANAGNFVNSATFAVTVQLVQATEGTGHRWLCTDPGDFALSLYTATDTTSHSGVHNFVEDDGVPGCQLPGAVQVIPMTSRGSQPLQLDQEVLSLRFVLPGGLSHTGSIELNYLDYDAWSEINNATVLGAFVGEPPQPVDIPVKTAEVREHKLPRVWRASFDWSGRAMRRHLGVLPMESILLTLAPAQKQLGVELKRVVPYWTVTRRNDGTVTDNARWPRPGYPDHSLPHYQYSEL
eukprot:Sspe_Gene.63752::Locus_36904_Transcript_2_8_Confidence_0.115_Length_1452::g.63752::m.63752